MWLKFMRKEGYGKGRTYKFNKGAFKELSDDEVGSKR